MQRATDQEYEDRNHHRHEEEYEENHHPPTDDPDGPDDTHSTLSGSPVSFVHDLGQVGQREEHPHLTGMCATYVMSTY